MKKLIGIVMALALMIGMSSLVFATDYETLMEQINQKLSTVELDESKANQVEELQAKGEEANDAGDTDKATEYLQQALRILGD